MNKKFSLQVNPQNNNHSYIESKFNLARGGNQDIDIEVLNYKISTNENMKTYDIFQKRGFEWSPMMMNIQINDIEQFISYVTDFCHKTYQRVKF